MKGQARDRRKTVYLDRYIVCSKCGKSSGTIVKVDDHYEHQDKENCRGPGDVLKKDY